MSNDLRSYLQGLEKANPEEIMTIDHDVSQDYFLTSLVMRLEKSRRYPLIQLNRVQGHQMPMVANVFASRERIAQMLDTTPTQLYQVWKEKEKQMIEPVQVEWGPIKENTQKMEQVDLTSLPIGHHFTQDAGPYVSSGILVAKDPDTGVYNLSYHRLQLKSKNRFGVSLHSRGHLWDYFKRAEEKKQSLEVAVIIGCHPLIYLAASSKMSIEADEYALAGSLMGEPLQLTKCATNGILVPAHAEIVLEGKILAGVREPEGPFGEYTGYATSRSTENVLEVTGIMKRNDPIYMDLIPGYSSEHLLLGRIPKEAEVISQMKNKFPYIRAINFPKSGTHFHAYMSMKKTAEGQPKHALMLLLGLDMYLKLVVVVDDDIDVYNEEEVLWALATRVQADKDVFIVSDVICNMLDPSSEDGMSAKMAIDATKPLDWDMALCTTDSEADQAVEKILKNQL